MLLENNLYFYQNDSGIIIYSSFNIFDQFIQGHEWINFD